MKRQSKLALDYANQVVRGEIVSGKLAKLACQRFLDDLERDDIFYIEEKANRACSFI